jgi:hypothetical protein
MTMLPRLEAEAQIARINAGSLAFGGVKPAERQRQMSRLQRQAAGGRAAQKATPGMLGMMGIAVSIVEPEAGHG